MAPRSEAFKRIRQRLRRSLRYGSTRMDCLPLQLSELVVNYFGRCSTPNNQLDLDFAAQISNNICLDPCTLVAAMIYIERLRYRNPTAFSQSDPNDLYLSAVMLATKFLNDCGLDEYIWSEEWAEIAQTSTNRLCQLELRMLDNLNWDLMITCDQFDTAVRSLERGVAIKSAKTSGFLSYTDMEILAADLQPYLEHAKRFLIMSATVASTYMVLWGLSCGLFFGAYKAVEIARDDVAVFESIKADCESACEPIIFNEYSLLVSLHSNGGNDSLEWNLLPSHDQQSVNLQNDSHLEKKLGFNFVKQKPTSCHAQLFMHQQTHLSPSITKDLPLIVV